MAWESFTVDEYEVTAVTVNTDGLPGVYGYIRLFWEGQQRATLWSLSRHRASRPTNHSSSGGVKKYCGRYSQTQFADCVDLLRNEKPVTFGWNEATKGALAGHWASRSAKANCHSGHHETLGWL